MNTVAIAGNVGRTPVLRATRGGNPVLSFSVGVQNRRWNGDA